MMGLSVISTAAIWVAEASPSPAAPATESSGGGGGLDFGTVVPLVTGAGGALVVLLLVVFLFATDRVTTVGAVTRLREADNNRFTDMVAQRDSLVTALEQANDTANAATNNAKQSLELLRELGGGSGGGTRRRAGT